MQIIALHFVAACRIAAPFAGKALSGRKRHCTGSASGHREDSRKAVARRDRKVPTRELPDWLVRAISLFVPNLKLVVNDLGKKESQYKRKSAERVGLAARSSEDVIVAAAKSLVQLGIVER